MIFVFLLALVASLNVFFLTEDLTYLYAALIYLTFHAIIGYYIAFKSMLGLVTFEPIKAHKIIYLINSVYLYVVIIAWFYIPIWAALLTPWIAVITSTNVASMLFVRKSENDGND